MKTAKVIGLDAPWQLQQLADAVIEQVRTSHQRRDRQNVGLTVPPSLLVAADEVIE